MKFLTYQISDILNPDDQDRSLLSMFFYKFLTI